MSVFLVKEGVPAGASGQEIAMMEAPSTAFCQHRIGLISAIACTFSSRSIPCSLKYKIWWEILHPLLSNALQAYTLLRQSLSTATSLGPRADRLHGIPPSSTNLLGFLLSWRGLTVMRICVSSCAWSVLAAGVGNALCVSGCCMLLYLKCRPLWEAPLFYVPLGQEKILPIKHSMLSYLLKLLS